MAVITLSNPTYYAGGTSGVSSVVGYESNQNRVCRFQFTAPDTGASSVEFSQSGISFGAGSSNVSIRFLITDDGNSYANAGNGTPYSGTISISGNKATASVSIVLLPGKTYYLWLFPGTSTFGWWYWTATATLTTYGGAGIINYDTGSAWEQYLLYYDTGSTWVQIIVYYDTGSELVLIT